MRHRSVAFGLLIGALAHAACAQPTQAPGSEWTATLRAGLAGRDSEPHLKRLLAEGREERTRLLARLLLDELALPATDPVLGSPRIVSIRWPKPADLTSAQRYSQLPLIVVQAIIDEDGRALDVALEHSTGNQQLDELCVESVRNASFRPAVNSGRYVRRSTTLHLHWPL
jgi:TonB family protein